MKKLNLTFCATMILAGVSQSLSAATVAWNTPTPISAPTDVSAVGSLVDSIMFSNTNANTSVTVNGVTFDRAIYPGGGPPYPLNSAAGNISTHEDDSQVSTAPATGDSNYDKLLSTESYSLPRNIYDITLSGLTAGHLYMVQAWVDDSYAPGGTGQNDLYLYGGSSHTDGVLVVNGNYITGYFTADAATETLAWGGNPAAASDQFAFGTIDALQVREVPEPSALVALVGLGAMGLFVVVRRYRKA